MTPIEPGRRERPWYQKDTRRLSAAQRGYDSQWQSESEQYRKLHPLCVPCLLRNHIEASRCVDHIVPRHSCPSLFWDPLNWAAMCFRCHGYKTRKEPQESWDPRPDRIVVCGLPGTGKSTFARSVGVPYWDADERPQLNTIQAIIAARNCWIAKHEEPCVVIVASITTASQVAARIRGVVRHMTERFVERMPRVAALER